MAHPDIAVPHLPLWALYVQAFGTIFAAVAAALIASLIQYRQWKIASEKLRLDLLDRRRSIYHAYLGEIVDEDNFDPVHTLQNIKTWQSGMIGYFLFFERDITDSMDETRLYLLLLAEQCRRQNINIAAISHYNSLISRKRHETALSMLRLLQFHY